MHLGHRRLSIIDLSAAADQPLRKDSLTLIYNGELYNYKELRARAAAGRGPPSSPPRTPRSCLRPGGTGARRRWTGSAACSRSRSPTRATGELVLARDPLGIKPLFYTERGDGVVFASELKALVAALGPELRIEPGALVASMLYYWVPEQRCAIQGVQQAAGRLVGQVPAGRQRPRSGSTGGSQDVAAEAAARPAGGSAVR